jgi:CDP-diacylglycerol--glycerol-3-phosphate 3-phosphatidyltransferase
MKIGSQRWKGAIPWSMVIFRAILAPTVFVVALRLKAPEAWLGGMIAAALVSDVYDGVLARRWGTATARLRTADSMADTAFYLGVLAAIILRHWPALQERLGLLITLLALEALRMGFDWMKFRRFASYHSYASKLWGLSLAVTAFALLAFNRGFWLLSLALALGIFCDLEGLAISVVLRQSAQDVKSLCGALALRRQIGAQQ